MRKQHDKSIIEFKKIKEDYAAMENELAGYRDREVEYKKELFKRKKATTVVVD